MTTVSQLKLIIIFVFPKLLVRDLSEDVIFALFKSDSIFYDYFLIIPKANIKHKKC